MAELIQYKCPCCGGSIEFNSAVQKMKCPYCDTEFEMSTLKEYDEELKNQTQDDMSWNIDSESQWHEGEKEGLRVFICNSCGGEVIGDDNTAATVCPFCETPIVVKEQFSGTLRPDYVIPFKLDKKAAKEGFMNHLRGKRLLPKIFKEENHIDEIKGLYVPFWLFDADADASIRYRATKVRRWTHGDDEFIETKHYSITRDGTIGFELIPVDASSKIANDLMESIEPFDFKEAREFQTAYLASYLSDKYDVDEQKAIERANERIRQGAEETFLTTVQGYTSVNQEYSSIHLKNGKTKYVLYPVWIMNTTWNNRKYTFAMNGQTGKFVGDLPCDNVAYCKWLFGLTGVIMVIAFSVLSLVWFL